MPQCPYAVNSEQMRERKRKIEGNRDKEVKEKGEDEGREEGRKEKMNESINQC